MRIVAATAFPELLARPLASHNDWLYFADVNGPPLDADFFRDHRVDVLVTFGYGRMIPAEVLQQVRGVNLHGSLLPWNRGPNPNIWSWLHDTPKGVTLHELSDGMDSGGIIASREIPMQAEQESLNSSFRKLLLGLAALFSEHWAEIRNGSYTATVQQGSGSYHYRRDRDPIAQMMTEHADMPLSELLPKLRAVHELPQRRLQSR